jgi:hypothetical protein
MIEDEFERIEKCYVCGVTSGVKLISKQEFGGCIPVSITYCKPCLKKQEEDDKARNYQKTHFCNSCNEKFKRPHRKNVRTLDRGSRFMPYRLHLCLACYEIEIKRNPVVEEDINNDPWGVESSTEDVTNLW